MGTNIQEGWINHLRNASRQNPNRDPTSTKGDAIVECVCGSKVTRNLDTFRKHVADNRTSHAGINDVDDTFKNLSVQPSKRRRNNDDNGQDDANKPPANSGPNDEEYRDSKKLRSPASSDIQSSNPPTPTPTTPSQRSRARKPQPPDDFNRGYPPRPPQTHRLYDPGDDPGSPNSKVGGPPGAVRRAPTKAPRHQQGQVARVEASEQLRLQVDPERPHTSLMKQPDTKPISHEQLVAEVKGIYTGLVMIESKCIEVDTAQSANTTHKLGGEQWQALIALHRTLLHEHHDFFLASQHPAASEALRRLAGKYAMPARMWRHGIHSFLELLRHRLPDSYDQMLTFIYMAYGMMALLYETVRAFEDTWVECLGDLARYRMAIEEHDIKDRETWTAVARSWYSKASEKAPTTGRLYHHLAILARPNVVRQIYYYTKSLVVPMPFLSARESITTLFDPVFTPNPPRLESIDLAFVRIHAIIFSGKHQDLLTPAMEEYHSLLDNWIGRTAKRWNEMGYCTGISLGCALLGYGAEDHFMMQLINPAATDKSDNQMDGVEFTNGPDETFNNALSFMVKTYKIAVIRHGDPHTLAFLHTVLAFMLHLSRFPAAMGHIAPSFPWELTAMRLNTLLKELSKPKHGEPKIPEPEPIFELEEFPGAKEVREEEERVKKEEKDRLAGILQPPMPDAQPEQKELPRPLPEDFALNGLIYVDNYFPKQWFKYSQKLEEEEKYFELSSMDRQRTERLLWLGCRLAFKKKWLTWDENSRQFGVVEEAQDPVEDTTTSATTAVSDTSGTIV